MGFVSDFIFGDSGIDPQAFRGYGWQQQGRTLNDILMGQMTSPQQLEQLRSFNPELYNQLKSSPFIGAAPSFTPGEVIRGQYQPTTPNYSDRQLADFTPMFERRSAFEFSTPGQAFNYQFPTFDAETAVGDAFTPQYNIAQRLTQRADEEAANQIMADMARRGVLGGGATTQAMIAQKMGSQDRLANLADQLAAQQGQARLGAMQFGAGLGMQQQQMLQQEAARRQSMDWSRQMAQAEELFRQQGASDQQARDLANAAIQRRQFQVGAQQQRFGQQVGGRQLGLQEYALGQQMRRQPMEDLMRLYAYSTGAQEGQAGTPGALAGLIGGFGQGTGQALGTAMFL